MDHMKVLKRAWEITWRYRALWIFGIIIALTTASGGRGGGGGGGGAPAQYNGDDFGPGGEFPMPEIPPEIAGILIAIGAAVACVVVILILASVVARYVAETALIRMVDDYEETGEKRSIREGFRLGWSRTALRLFLINLIIDLPTAVVFISLFLLPAGLIVLSALAIERISEVVGVIGIVAGIGLVFLIVLLLIVVGAALSLLKRFFRRVCALEEVGVIESIRQGFDVVKRHLLWDVAIMWIIMIGLGIAWMLLMIPVTILLFVVGLMLAGPALLIGGLATLLGGPMMWILAAVVGIPILILVVAVPSLFLGGLMEVFKSSVWTLTYRELRALEGLETEPDELPGLDAPDLE